MIQRSADKPIRIRPNLSPMELSRLTPVEKEQLGIKPLENVAAKHMQAYHAGGIGRDDFASDKEVRKFKRRCAIRLQRQPQRLRGTGERTCEQDHCGASVPYFYYCTLARGRHRSLLTCEECRLFLWWSYSDAWESFMVSDGAMPQANSPEYDRYLRIRFEKARRWYATRCSFRRVPRLELFMTTQAKSDTSTATENEDSDKLARRAVVRPSPADDDDRDDE